MRNLKVLALAGVFALSCLGLVKNVTAAEDLKIGYIDVASVFDAYDGTKDQDASLGAKSQKKQKERESMVEKIRNMKNELELLSDAQKEKKQAQIDEEIRKLQDFDRVSKEELRGERDNMVRDILKEIDLVINEHAKKNGYTLILNSRILVYGQEKYDITKEILNILNSKYRRKK